MPGGPPPPPTVSLPKGGGAIRDIGEKLAVNIATGTASLTVPVPASPSRSGFGPTLTLSYDSGAGNGPFGLGWKLSVPSVTRKTDKGLPRYVDDPDADTFILSGSEDLVPFREQHGGRWEQSGLHRHYAGREYLIQRYRPRIEGLFARIERWRDVRSGETHWRSISAANVTTRYGVTAASRIADPADPDRVYSWLASESYDDVGNAIVYEYRAEDRDGVDTTLPSERHRSASSVSANRYLTGISYGNRVPWPASFGVGGDPAARPADPRWMFEVVFDYGDFDPQARGRAPERSWPSRPDPFSTYRPGFEVRTYRRCHRVLMVHHFPDEPGVGAHGLVSSTDLRYVSTGSAGMTTLASVTHTGYRPQGDGYRAQSLPPAEFSYSQAVIGRDIADLSPDALANLPQGIDGTGYEWVDLDGDGVSGILARQGNAWYYKANLGQGRFALERMLPAQPVTAGGGGRQQLLDLAGDGHLDLAELGGAMPGFYERTAERGWLPFRPFRASPAVNWDDPDLRLVDLDGDGLADVLITRDDAFTWYPSLRYDGFGDGRRAYQPWPEGRGPRVLLADPEHAVYLADMTGDGLSDLVRVRNGEVCYWPNTGFGQFGAKITMDHSPWLDDPDGFDQRRVRLADVDGSGTADLVYLHRDNARLYVNRSGNGYGEAHPLGIGFPRLDSLASVMLADLLGQGTACLVWSSPLPADSGRQLRYLNLMARGKPYLLTRVVNNLGGETRISYEPSTRFYLADQAAGRPWATKLPFPVYVVTRVEVTDRINHNRFTTRYAYHHGYYDGFEREFGGFGMVEQYDAEEFSALESGTRPPGLDRATDVPPVMTRTWLHTGVFAGAERVSRVFEREYWRQPGGGDPDLPDTRLPDTLRLAGERPRPWRLSVTEAREACRALKGLPLREEIYGLDGSAAAGRPYAVSEHNYTIELLQPALDPRPDGPQNYHGIFLTHAREHIGAHYERALYPVSGTERADPRIAHDLVLAADDYGNPLRTATAGYGRRFPGAALTAEDQRSQARLLLTATENAYTNAVDLPDAHRTPALAQTRTFEVAGLHPRHRPLFAFAELSDGLDSVQGEVPYQDWDFGADDLPAPARRLVEHTRVKHRRDDLSGPLPFGVLEPLALPYRTYRLAFDAGLLEDIYGARVTRQMLTEAGYVRDAGTWWVPSGQVFYSPAAHDNPEDELAFARSHFFLALRFRDPFGNTATAGYDAYDLLVAHTRDALGNVVSAGDRDAEGRTTSPGLDYRVLQPFLVSDPNRNRTAVAFDILGRIAGTAIMGKPGEHRGDTLDGFDPDPPDRAVRAYFGDPFEHAHRLLGRATTRVLYDLDAYRRSQDRAQPEPSGVALLARETHDSDLASGQSTLIQRSFTYSDGFAREVQHKSQAAPGPLEDGGPEVRRRWTGSGWTIYDNKSRPVRSYEPFFTATAGFEFARAAGVSSVLFYDPPGRVVATLHPDDSYEKTVLDPWHQASWDGNDTVLLDPRGDPDVSGYLSRYLAALSQERGGWQTWYAQRSDGQAGPPERRAARQAALHAGTPSLTFFDSLGRAYLGVEHNRLPHEGTQTEEFYRTRSLLDIEGNIRVVQDALGRAVMRYGYLMAHDLVTHAGMDTGEVVTFPDVTGQPTHSWDSRGFAFRTHYDALRRPVRGLVAGPGITGTALQLRTVYGDTLPGGDTTNPDDRNLRTRVVVQHDNAGVVTNEAYDFKGNLLRSRRELAAAYRDIPDWDGPVSLTGQAYLASTSYDALNRPVAMITPDGTVTIPGYNAAGQLDRIQARLRGAAQATTFVAHIGYNARGQRIAVSHGNGVHCAYTYDPLTFRPVRLATQRRGRRLQDLRYTYDPVGNPVRIRDHAQQRVFFRNQVVGASARYIYDAVYRLIEATGREHLGQVGGELRPVPPSAGHPATAGLPQPGEAGAMARYVERYSYDAAGNLLRLAHRTTDPRHGGWTREYRYTEPSLLQPDRSSNRLTSTGPARHQHRKREFRYDEQGNTTSMPGTAVLGWDPEDRLHVTARQASSGERLPAPSYYVYDGTGQRVRKVTDAEVPASEPAAAASERIYLGSFEVYREYGTDGSVTLERETLHLLDGSRRVALVETRTAGTDPGPAELTRYQHADHLGSSVLELDSGGRVATYEEYVPYGSTSYQAVRSKTETPKRYRFTGKERDTETGLYYHGARYYAPWLARWMSCDPAGLADGVNIYAYVSDNPVRRSDPTGLAARNPQLHFVESKAYQQQATATATGRGFSKALKGYYKRVVKAWSAPGKYDIAHPEDKPFAFQKPGQAVDVRLGDASANRSAGALSRPTVAAARAAGKPVRTTKGNWPGAVKGTRYGQPKLRSGSEPVGIKPKPLRVQPNPPPARQTTSGALADQSHPTAQTTAPTAVDQTTQPVQTAPPPANQAQAAPPPTEQTSGPVQKPAPPPENTAAKPATPAPTEQGGGGIGGWLKEATGSLAEGALSMAPGIALEFGRRAQQEKYDKAAQVRGNLTGAPTPEQIQQQHNVGYEYRGLDSSGRPQWEYDPGVMLRIQGATHMLFNPFEPLNPTGHDDDPYLA